MNRRDFIAGAALSCISTQLPASACGPDSTAAEVTADLDVTISLAASLLIAAGLVTAAELLLQAWFHDLGASFTVFLPLLAVNVIVIDHALEPPTGLTRALNRSVSHQHRHRAHTACTRPGA